MYVCINMLVPLPIRTGRLGQAFFLLKMSKIPFNKPPLTYSQQLQKLKERGLIINNEKKTLHILESVSYYRLSGYWYPLLQDKQNHVFKKDATFEKPFTLFLNCKKRSIFV